MVRTRIAPSPTGYPHIATIYQALFDFAYARNNKGTFIVRIEDTDRERFVPDAEEKLYEALDWFGLTEDESPRKNGPYGPYKQSERLSFYQKYADELVSKGHAYLCFCSKERLEEVHKKQQQEKKPLMYDKHCRNLSSAERDEKAKTTQYYVIRLKVPENEKIVVHDEIRGEIEFDSNLVDDQVLLKSDGFPTYHLAVVVDDHLMKITHVVRGEEWLSSFPKHVLLYRFFKWSMPKFYHTAVLRNPDHSKLSKRQGHTNVSWYREEGFLPEAILNYIATLGWGHPQEKEIFDLEEFIREFDLNDIRPIGPVFDINKLRWMNGIYIREKYSVEKLAEKLLERYPEYKKLDKNNFLSIVELAQTRMETLNDFDAMARYFIEPKVTVTMTVVDKNLVKDLREKLAKISTWDEENILNALRPFLKSNNVKMSIIYKFVTGFEKGLPLPKSLEVLGKEETLARLENL